MLYMGSKKWERAQLFLELVLVSPAINTASMIQVEAYKKWILVNLLLKGHVSNIFGLNLCKLLMDFHSAFADAKDGKRSNRKNISESYQSIREHIRSLQRWNNPGDDRG